jgi:hypothetical protein
MFWYEISQLLMNVCASVGKKILKTTALLPEVYIRGGIADFFRE